MRSSLLLISGLTLLVVLASRAGAIENYVFAVTTDLEISGSCATLEIDPPWETQTGLEEVHSDAVARYHGCKVYVVNRLYRDNIQVLDPEQGFETISEFSVGAGSNPQDIVVISEERAYVSRLQSRWLYEVNPVTGAITDSIDMGGYADADGVPETANMFLDGNRLFVQIQRLDTELYWDPVPPSYLAMVDIITNEPVDLDPEEPGTQGIVLTGLNPFGEMYFDEYQRKLYVSESGYWDQLDGGIDVVDIDLLASQGFITTESQLGGELNDFAFASSQKGYAVISTSYWPIESRGVSFSRVTGDLLDAVWVPGGYVADIEVDRITSQLFLCDRTITSPGVHVFDTESDLRLTPEPINTGLPPFDLLLIRCGPAEVVHATSGDEIGPSALSWAVPNPCRRGTQIFFASPCRGTYRLDIFDVLGRKVRSLPGDEVPRRGLVRARWDGCDESGRAVGQGIYLYRIVGRSLEATGRIAVVR